MTPAAGAGAGAAGPRVDLHTHSTYSDGTDDPAGLWRLAAAAGLGGLAVTDHDTTAAWDELARTRPAGMVLVRGSELSTHLRVAGRTVSIHVLAYLFDPADPALAAELARLRDDRLHRGMEMVQKMVGAGVAISPAQVLEIAAGAPVGRPHIARALIDRGLVSSVTEAFGSYLSGRGPYYVAKADTPLHVAIELVRGAGGVPVIAHPRSRGAVAVTDLDFFRSCREAGLVGIEVDHPDHDDAARAELRGLARSLGLVATAASDFHGANKTVRIGQEAASMATVAALAERSSGRVGVLGPGPEPV